MAALSDYLESGLLNHLFRGSSFSKPTTIALALTSGVPSDNDTGATLPELPSGIDGASTNYLRTSLDAPSDNTWDAVGVDNNTAYVVYQDSNIPSESGYFYPLYLAESKAKTASNNNTANSHTFAEYGGVTFFSPPNLEKLAQSTQPSSSLYTLYDGNGFIKNKTQITFNTANSDWGWVSGIAVVDNDGYGEGNMLMYSKLTNPRYVYKGDTIKFDSQSLEISLK